MHMLVKALYGEEDIEYRRRNVAAHLAYLLGTRPVADPTSKGGTTMFYHLTPPPDKQSDDDPWSPLLWTTSPAAPVEMYARNALAGIPPYKVINTERKQHGKGDLLARPTPGHFSSVYLQLASLSNELAVDCGKAFTATLDPPGYLLARNAVVSYTPNEEWLIVVTPATETKQRFTKCLNVEWTQNFRKVKRVQRQDGTWELETDAGERFTIRERVKQSRLYNECLRLFDTEYGWTEGAVHDPVDFTVNTTRATGLALWELAPCQKGAAVVSGDKDAGKSTLIETSATCFGSYRKPKSGLRGSDEDKSRINFEVRRAEQRQLRQPRHRRCQLVFGGGIAVRRRRPGASVRATRQRVAQQRVPVRPGGERHGVANHNVERLCA
jgi:hypothetical protein